MRLNISWISWNVAGVWYGTYRTVTSHPSVAIGPTSIVNGNERAAARVRVARGCDVTVFMRGHADGATYRRRNGTREIYKFPLKICHLDPRCPCQFEPDVCADAAARVPAHTSRLRADPHRLPIASPSSILPSSAEYERPDRIHHTDLGFYRYFASPPCTVYPSTRRICRVFANYPPYVSIRGGGKKKKEKTIYLLSWTKNLCQNSNNRSHPSLEGRVFSRIYHHRSCL